MIVLDTHALIWAVQNNPKLGLTAREHVEREAQEDVVLVPAMGIWEVALIVSRGQVVLPLDMESWTRRVLSWPGYQLAPLEPAIAIASVDLAWEHKDPADRMIVATARYWKAPLLTADEKILAYAEAGHVVAIDARR